MSDRPPRPEDAWDEFIDALDRAGQAGGAHTVLVPSLGHDTLGGRPFGDLTRHDVRRLARVGGALGRRETTIVTIWDDMQRRKRRALAPDKKKNRR